MHSIECVFALTPNNGTALSAAVPWDLEVWFPDGTPRCAIGPGASPGGACEPVSFGIGRANTVHEDVSRALQNKDKPECFRKAHSNMPDLLCFAFRGRSAFAVQDARM